MYNRPIFLKIVDRLKGTRTFIQVLAGPRQTGKTTLARQAMDAIGIPAHYASADEPALKDRIWIEQQWEAGRLRCREEGAPALLVLDEIQKISGWSETVKRLWDEDSASNRPLRVLLLGSSPLLVKAGLSESLAGRFEIVPVTHWSFAEMRDAFGYTLEQYLIFGGYPGAAALIAIIEDNRNHLRQYPASCSARIRREETFDKLYALNEERFGMSRAQTDQQYRTLDDYALAELEYEKSKTCCWNSTTSRSEEHTSELQYDVSRMPSSA